MRFTSRTFWLAKDAANPNAFQDSFDIDVEKGSAAIADGVSATLFSGPWARELTRATIASAPNLDNATEFGAWLAECRAVWAKTIDTSKLSYFQRMKMREMVDGAMSTLLWIDFLPVESDLLADNGEYQVSAYSVGDCNLFHVRDGICLSTFPMTSSAEFGLSPDVLRSIGRGFDHLVNFKVTTFLCRPSDLLVLCTDAIGQWALTCLEENQPIEWERYWDLTDESWREEIFSLRQASRMRVDDTTLLLLRVNAVVAAGNSLAMATDDAVVGALAEAGERSRPGDFAIPADSLPSAVSLEEHVEAETVPLAAQTAERNESPAETEPLLVTDTYVAEEPQMITAPADMLIAEAVIAAEESEAPKHGDTPASIATDGIDSSPPHALLDADSDARVDSNL